MKIPTKTLLVARHVAEESWSKAYGESHYRNKAMTLADAQKACADAACAVGYEAGVRAALVIIDEWGLWEGVLGAGEDILALLDKKGESDE